MTKDDLAYSAAKALLHLANSGQITRTTLEVEAGVADAQALVAELETPRTYETSKSSILTNRIIAAAVELIPLLSAPKSAKYKAAKEVLQQALNSATGNLEFCDELRLARFIATGTTGDLLALLYDNVWPGLQMKIKLAELPESASAS